MVGALDALPVVVDESLDGPQKLSARSFLEVRWVTDHLQPHWVFEKCTILRGANVPTLAGITLTPNEKTTLNLTHSTKARRRLELEWFEQIHKPGATRAIHTDRGANRADPHRDTQRGGCKPTNR